MQLPDHFAELLTGTVNLPDSKLEKLDDRVEAIYDALAADEVLGALVKDKIPQGSWAHETIINPQREREFDADFLLHLDENTDWSSDPVQYREELYAALGRHPTYKGMPRSRKCRCVRVTYADFCHVDIVPYVKLGGWQEVIVMGDDNEWENTNPTGFTEWMQERDAIAEGNLRRVIRLLKYLRDKSDWYGTKSVILTTLVGDTVNGANKLSDPGYYGSLPTALLHIVQDLDDYLQANPTKPSVPDPSRTGGTFDHRWEEPTYLRFRDRIHGYRTAIEEAYDEPNKERSVELWQAIFGTGFKAPAPAGSGSGKFGTVPPAATTGRSGRAG